MTRGKGGLCPEDEVRRIGFDILSVEESSGGESAKKLHDSCSIQE